MPTFPLPSLKFRTAGFPQYGYKASISDGVFHGDPEVKPHSRHTLALTVFAPPFAHIGRRHTLASCDAIHGSKAVVGLPPACAADPQGSLAPVRVVLSRSISAYYDPIRQSRRHAAISRSVRLYATPSLCGSA
jgi:hypothetical protein